MNEGRARAHGALWAQGKGEFALGMKESHWILSTESSDVRVF